MNDTGAAFCAPTLIVARRTDISRFLYISSERNPLFSTRRRRRPYRLRREMKMDAYNLLGGTIESFTSSPDLLLTGATLGLATSVVGGVAFLREREVFSGQFARKAVHVTCGLAYIFLWCWYESRWAAIVVPSSALLVSLSLSVPLSRILKREEETSPVVLRGPISYMCILVLLTAFEWKTDAAHIAVAELCLGDAAAEICGRLYGAGNRWPFAKNKSIAGSAAFVAAGTLGSTALVAWNGGLSGMETVAVIFAISIGCSLAELIPERFVGDDNISVTATALLLSHLFL